MITRVETSTVTLRRILILNHNVPGNCQSLQNKLGRTKSRVKRFVSLMPQNNPLSSALMS